MSKIRGNTDLSRVPTEIPNMIVRDDDFLEIEDDARVGGVDHLLKARVTADGEHGSIVCGCGYSNSYNGLQKLLDASADGRTHGFIIATKCGRAVVTRRGSTNKTRRS